MKRTSMEVTLIEDSGRTTLLIHRPGSTPRKETGKKDQGVIPFETIIVDELRKLFQTL